MKTQLHRMKQRAAQSVGRAEKTELLTEDLQSVERTVDKVKIACTTTSKKLNACMISNGPDLEKRKKKLPQLHLGHGMLENASELGEKSLLGGIMFKAGEAQGAIAGELATYETELDAHVLAPLHELTEVLIPNIGFTKKKLSTAQLDMDSSKTRWQSAVKISQAANSTNKVEATAKANLLQSDYEDQSLLFQQIQDQLATDMLTFVAGERRYAQWIFKMLEAQTRYHQAALNILKECVPNVEKQIEDDVFRPPFGCPLDVHLRINKREIATILEDCIIFLLQNAMDMQGLFRLAGSSSKIKKLKASLDIGYADIEDYIFDIHAVTGVLKLYLRELPDPLLTFKLYEDWINASKMDIDARLQKIKELVDLLPKGNKDNLRYLVCFLAQLAENCEENKMSASNIAIVIGPNVLWDSDDGGINLKTTGNISIILETLIENCQYIFPEGCDFTRQHPVDGDSVNNRFEDMETHSSTEHLGNTCNDQKPKKAEKKGNSKEDITNLENSGGGNIYSDMFKKLHKEKKDTEKKDKGGTSGGVQGYYNPVSATLDSDVNNTTSEEFSLHRSEAVIQKRSLSQKDLSPPYSPHRRLSNSEAPKALDEREDRGHQRSPSAGSTPDMDIKPVTPSAVREKNRRPAPPVPKYPPLAPPKSKPPEPPKHKPPEPPPNKPLGVPPAPPSKPPHTPTEP